jgi:hypothetical protein
VADQRIGVQCATHQRFGGDSRIRISCNTNACRSADDQPVDLERRRDQGPEPVRFVGSGGSVDDICANDEQAAAVRTGDPAPRARPLLDAFRDTLQDRVACMLAEYLVHGRESIERNGKCGSAAGLHGRPVDQGVVVRRRRGGREHDRYQSSGQLSLCCGRDRIVSLRTGTYEQQRAPLIAGRRTNVGDVHDRVADDHAFRSTVRIGQPHSRDGLQGLDRLIRERPVCARARSVIIRAAGNETDQPGTQTAREGSKESRQRR